jgi:hypothetical protein
VAWFFKTGQWSKKIVAELDHICKNPRCVRPDHLEIVTHKVNMVRGLLRSTCKSFGHSKHITSNGFKYCRECHKERNRVYREKLRQKICA